MWLLVLSLLHPSGQIVQLWDELVEQQDAKSCSEFGCIWLVARHQQCSSGSVLGPVLFKISLSDLEARVERPISRFADDVKPGGAADSLEGQESLQRDGVGHWAVISGMKFNKSKCQIFITETVGQSAQQVCR